MASPEPPSLYVSLLDPFSQAALKARHWDATDRQ
jgi:hypothetical protein